MEEKNEDKMNKIKKIRHTIVVYLTIAVITFCAVMLLYTQVLINAYIPSESMENTLMTGDRVIGNRLAYKFGNDPERFDIVIFDAPDNMPGYYIKRIIGMPGVFLGFCFSLTIIFSLTISVSKMSIQIKDLTQEIALYKKEQNEKMDEIEKK